MENDLILETSGEEEIPFEDEDLPANIANLAAALSSLTEIDGGMMAKNRQAKLARMKRLVFDALVYYTDCLPQLEKEED